MKLRIERREIGGTENKHKEKVKYRALIIQRKKKRIERNEVRKKEEKLEWKRKEKERRNRIGKV